MSDPTGTAGLRRSFLAEGNRRLGQLRSQTHTILVERDLMAAKNDPLAQLMPNPGHRLSAFTGWFERTATALLVGEDWWSRFLARAQESGTRASAALIGVSPHGQVPVPAVYREMVQREFEGIAAAMVQQVSRQAGNAAIAGNKPLPMYRAVLSVLRKVGEARVRATVNTTTVQLHNAARLMQYRAAGIAQVGIVPEIPEPARSSPFGARRTSHDANPYHDPHGRFTTGGGAGGSGGEGGAAAVTKTPAFKNWFGKSKVVNPDGSPRTVYHGTTTPEDFHHFSVGEPVEDPTGEYHRSGSGSDPRTFLGSHFAQEPHVANKFAQGLYGERAGRSEGGRVLPVHLRVENPHVSSDSKMLNEMMRGNYNHHDIDAALDEHGDIEETGPKYDSDPNYREEINQRAIDMGQQADEPDHSLAQEMAQQYRQKLQEKGHDGIKYRNEIEGGTSWIIFHPGQVKSAIGNVGGFSRKKHGIGDHLVRDDSYILQAKQALEAAQQALTEAQARTAQAELEASQAQARAEVAAAKAETAQNEAETTAAEAAQGGWTAKQQEYRTTKAQTAAVMAMTTQSAALQAQAEADQAESDAEQARQDEADAQAALEALPSLFAVLTAGDEKVCQICQDLAAEGPYGLDEAWPLLPAHPNCRCAWIPAGEATGEE
jgi:hypothetical protein